jgi:hypothetical protein
MIKNSYCPTSTHNNCKNPMIENTWLKFIITENKDIFDKLKIFEVVGLITKDIIHHTILYLFAEAYKK